MVAEVESSEQGTVMQVVAVVQAVTLERMENHSLRCVSLFGLLATTIRLSREDLRGKPKMLALPSARLSTPPFDSCRKSQLRKGLGSCHVVMICLVLEFRASYNPQPSCLKFLSRHSLQAKQAPLGGLTWSVGQHSDCSSAKRISEPGFSKFQMVVYRAQSCCACDVACCADGILCWCAKR